MKTKILTLILTIVFLNIYSQESEYSEKILKNGWYELNSSNSGITKAEKKTGIKYLKKLQDPLIIGK